MQAPNESARTREFSPDIDEAITSAAAKIGNRTGSSPVLRQTCLHHLIKGMTVRMEKITNSPSVFDLQQSPQKTEGSLKVPRGLSSFNHEEEGKTVGKWGVDH